MTSGAAMVAKCVPSFRLMESGSSSCFMILEAFGRENLYDTGCESQGNARRLPLKEDG
jgi:hypothetical protein